MRPTFKQVLPVLAIAAVLAASRGAAAQEAAQPAAQLATLTLAQAVGIALESNPAVAAAKASLAAAGYGVDASLTGFLPQVTGSVGYRRASQNVAGDDSIGTETGTGTGTQGTVRASGESYDSYSASLGLQQTIWDFGRTLGPYNASKAQARAAAADLRATVEDTCLQVGQAYFTAIAARQSVEAAEEAKRQMTEHLAAAKGRMDAGLRPRIDVTRAQADLSSAELALVQAVNAERTARVALATAIGRPGMGAVQLERPLASDPPGAEDLQASIDEALGARPEILRLREQVQAAQWHVTAARGGYWPSLGANAGMTYTGLKIDDMAWNWYVGASLNWSLVSGIVQANAQAKQAQANVAALKANLASLENATRAEVENAEVAWREARDKQAPAQDLLAAARETLDLAEARYAVGSGNVTEIADAQATLVKARTSAIQVELDIETARLKLLRSLGRLSSVLSAP